MAMGIVCSPLPFLFAHEDGVRGSFMCVGTQLVREKGTSSPLLEGCSLVQIAHV